MALRLDPNSLEQVLEAEVMPKLQVPVQARGQQQEPPLLHLRQQLEQLGSEHLQLGQVGHEIQKAQSTWPLVDAP
jgi:hypothetical protein